MHWHQTANTVIPHLVRIETPNGHGTGFLLLYNDTKFICGVATAAHVINYAEDWQQPLKINHIQSGAITLLKHGDRIIYRDQNSDSAVILFPASNLELPEFPIPLLPDDLGIKTGAEVGWLGFPAIARDTACFFSGNISARMSQANSYLIDGVAINGVSGGPVLYINSDNEPRIIGIISAYQANRATGEALPGLAISQDVSHFHSVALQVQAIDDDNRRKAEAQQFEQQPEETYNKADAPA